MRLRAVNELIGNTAQLSFDSSEEELLEEPNQRKGSMKKLILALAITGLVAGCAHDRGGTSDQNNMNTGVNSSSTAPHDRSGSGNDYNSNLNSNTNGVSNSPQL